MVRVKIVHSTSSVVYFCTSGRVTPIWVPHTYSFDSCRELSMESIRSHLGVTKDSLQGATWTVIIQTCFEPEVL